MKKNSKTQHSGKVKFFDAKKGFGFIIDDNEQREYFFHVTALVDAVNKGDEVTYIVGPGKKGDAAFSIEKVNT